MFASITPFEVSIIAEPSSTSLSPDTKILASNCPEDKSFGTISFVYSTSVGFTLSIILFSSLARLFSAS